MPSKVMIIVIEFLGINMFWARMFMPANINSQVVKTYTRETNDFGSIT